MFFSDASPTPYDLRFSVLGVPVRVHPAFWLVALFLGGDQPAAQAAVWVGAVLVSIVVHELGHAVVQRAFGGRPEITLYGFGGLASAPGVRETTGRNVVIALAGPLAGFALAAGVFAIVSSVEPPRSPLAKSLLGDLLWINVVWNVLNLAPIWPLDGGRVARELLVVGLPAARGVVASLVLSIGCAAALSVWLFAETGSLWNTALFALLGYQNYQALGAYRRSRGGR